MTRTAVALLLAFTLAFSTTGCVKRLAYVMNAPIGTRVSELIDRSDDDLAELAVRDMMGAGNSIREVQPNPDEAPQKQPMPNYGWVDHLYLAETVYGPYLYEYAKHPDPAKRRKVLIALCKWKMETGEVTWQKSPGEAIDQGVCPNAIGGGDVFRDPGAFYALAQALLEHHPKRDSLLDEVRLHLADTLGGRPDWICFDDNGHDPAVLKVNDGCYSDLWEAPGRPDEYHKVWTPVFHKVPLEERTPQQLAQTSALLLSVTQSSPRAKELPATLARIASLQTWKAAERIWPSEPKDAWADIPTIEKASAVLEKIPKDSDLFAKAQLRLADGKARIRKIKADQARAERERKLYEAKAAAEERRFLASLGPGQKRVYAELGMPAEEEPGPGGGKVWRYEDPIYSNLTDRFGSQIIIGYRWREYVFDASGNLIKRHSGAQ